MSCQFSHAGKSLLICSDIEALSIVYSLVMPREFVMNASGNLLMFLTSAGSSTRVGFSSLPWFQDDARSRFLGGGVTEVVFLRALCGRANELCFRRGAMMGTQA